VSSYSYDAFRKDVRARVRRLNARLTDPEANWPGVLIVDAANGLTAEAFELVDISDRALRELTSKRLPEKIRLHGGERFCWVMPVYLDVDERRLEYLLLIFGERGRAEASLAAVIRDGLGGPRLGPFSDSAFVGGVRRVAGRFVEPLLDVCRPRR